MLAGVPGRRAREPATSPQVKCRDGRFVLGGSQHVQVLVGNNQEEEAERPRTVGVLCGSLRSQSPTVPVFSKAVASPPPQQIRLSVLDGCTGSLRLGASLCAFLPIMLCGRSKTDDRKFHYTPWTTDMSKRYLGPMEALGRL